MYDTGVPRRQPRPPLRRSVEPPGPLRSAGTDRRRRGLAEQAGRVAGRQLAAGARARRPSGSALRHLPPEGPRPQTAAGTRRRLRGATSARPRSSSAAGAR